MKYNYVIPTEVRYLHIISQANYLGLLESLRGGYLRNNLPSVILQYLPPNALSLITVCAFANMGSTVNCKNSSTTATLLTATQRKQRSHWYLYFTLFMWHYFKKASNSEIPVLQMTCRACNIIQLSNFALYLSTERNYISLHMLWFIALCFVCAQRFLLRPLNHIATDGLQLALETHKKSFVKNKVNWQKIFSNPSFLIQQNK